MAATTWWSTKHLKFAPVIYFLWTFFVIADAHVHAYDITELIEFSEELPNRVSFLNSVGAIVRCSASSADTSWQSNDGKVIDDIPAMRRVNDGILEFLPFSPNKYRQDVHSAIYRCKASNRRGTIISSPVVIKAVVKQPYKARVYDEFVIEGNTGVLKCQVPGYVIDEIVVTGWVREDNLVIDARASQEKYAMSNDGHLYIHKVSMGDDQFSYWCRTKYRLDPAESSQLSETSGKLQIATGGGSNSIKPRITNLPGNVVAISGKEPIVLSCAGQGYPVPTYKWKTKNTQLTSNNRIKIVGGILIIQPSLKEDSGEYMCEVKNSAGSDLDKVNLIVRESLRSVVNPERQTVSAGDRLTLNCSAEGYPIHLFEWYKDGQKIDGNHRNIKQTHQMNFSTLNISHTERQNGGLYQCFVSNTWEASHAVSIITIGDIAPEILTRFDGRTLQPGPTLRLKCSARGKPNPRIQWNLDNLEIRNQDEEKGRSYVKEDIVNGVVNSELIVNSLRTEDGGEYKCTASNNIGEISHHSRINVYGLPSVRPMKDIKIIAGQRVNITCYASGYPINQIYWTGEDDVTLSDDQHLVFNQIRTKSDKLRYSCVAVGSAGKLSKESLNLIVIEKPSITPLMFLDEIYSGMDVSTMCYVNKGTKPVSITWLKDGKPIQHHLGITVTKASEYSLLKVKNTNSQHSGLYTCVASNEAGKTNRSASLNVKASPLWTIKPRNASVLQSTTSTFDCFSKSDPEAVVTWYKVEGKRSRKLKSKRYILFRNGTLSIIRTRKNDEGLYRCKISNGIPPDLHHTVKLNVGSVPVIINTKETLKLDIGDSLLIKCKTASEDNLKVKWFRNNDNLYDKRFVTDRKKTSHGQEFTLRLPQILSSDSAVYGCIVANEFGESSAKVHVIVKETVTENEMYQPLTTEKQLEVYEETTNQNGLITKSTNVLTDSFLVNVTTTQSVSDAKEARESTEQIGFKWKKYMLYYIIPAGIIILILVVALSIVLCLLCCSRDKERRSQHQQQYELECKRNSDCRVAKSVNYDDATVESRYGKLGGCRDRRPLSGSYPNLPVGDQHYLGFSPYGTLDHQPSHYTAAPR